MTYDGPSSVRVCGLVYTIAENAVKVREVTGDIDCWGATQHGYCAIWLAPGMSLEYTRTTVWHEIKHVIYGAVTGLFDKAKMSEEEAILRAASIEVAVFRDNPELVAWLTR